MGGKSKSGKKGGPITAINTVTRCCADADGHRSCTSVSHPKETPSRVGFRSPAVVDSVAPPEAKNTGFMALENFSETKGWVRHRRGHHAPRRVAASTVNCKTACVGQSTVLREVIGICFTMPSWLLVFCISHM